LCGQEMQMPWGRRKVKEGRSTRSHVSYQIADTYSSMTLSYFPLICYSKTLVNGESRPASLISDKPNNRNDLDDDVYFV
jgi:hypothetical protein